jgi:hypothetical protein
MSAQPAVFIHGLWVHSAALSPVTVENEKRYQTMTGKTDLFLITGRTGAPTVELLRERGFRVSGPSWRLR